MNRTLLLAIIGVVSYLIVLIPGYFFLPQDSDQAMMEEMMDPGIAPPGAETLVIPPGPAPNPGAAPLLVEPGPPPAPQE